MALWKSLFSHNYQNNKVGLQLKRNMSVNNQQNDHAGNLVPIIKCNLFVFINSPFDSSEVASQLSFRLDNRKV